MWLMTTYYIGQCSSRNKRRQKKKKTKITAHVWGLQKHFHKHLLICLSCEIDINPHFAERKTEAQNLYGFHVDRVSKYSKHDFIADLLIPKLHLYLCITLPTHVGITYISDHLPLV